MHLCALLFILLKLLCCISYNFSFLLCWRRYIILCCTIYVLCLLCIVLRTWLHKINNYTQTTCSKYFVAKATPPMRAPMAKETVTSPVTDAAIRVRGLGCNAYRKCGLTISKACDHYILCPQYHTRCNTPFHFCIFSCGFYICIAVPAQCVL